MDKNLESHKLNYYSKRFEPIDTKCKFCYNNAHSVNMEDNYFRQIFKEKERTNIIIYRDVTFDVVKIGIPRCPQCKKIHKIVEVVNLIFMVVGLILTLVIPIYLHVISNYISSVGMMFCLMALMFALTIGILYFIEWIVYRKFEMESPNEGSENDILINEFLSNGWTLKHPSA